MAEGLELFEEGARCENASFKEDDVINEVDCPPECRKPSARRPLTSGCKQTGNVSDSIGDSGWMTSPMALSLTTRCFMELPPFSQACFYSDESRMIFVVVSVRGTRSMKCTLTAEFFK